jgi:hypothetical protein
VEDLKGVSMKNFDMNNAKKINQAMQDNFPQRFGGIYIVNAGFIVKTLAAIARLIMKKKIVDRVRIIPKYEDLKEFIDPDQLIEEYGGTVKFDVRDWVDNLEKDFQERQKPQPSIDNTSDDLLHE